MGEQVHDGHGPKELGLGWWLMQVVGLAVVLGLMGVLAVALTMLTRMPIEGRTDPDLHLPTFFAWFVLCTVLVVGSMLRGTWRELKDERVHVDAFGTETRVDRWSAPHERQLFAERVAADERAHERAQAAAAAAPQTTAPAASRPEPGQEELREAARRRREVVPGISEAVPTGRWSAPLRRLETVAAACLIGWLPLLIVVVVVVASLEEWSDVPVERGLVAVPMVLLPVGLLLRWVHLGLRHAWLRTRETRSDLAAFQGIGAFIAAFLLAIVAFTGLVDREFIVVTVICLPLVVILGWLARQELRHHVPSGDGGSDGGNDVPDLSWID